ASVCLKILSKQPYPRCGDLRRFRQRTQGIFQCEHEAIARFRFFSLGNVHAVDQYAGHLSSAAAHRLIDEIDKRLFRRTMLVASDISTHGITNERLASGI